MQVVVAAQDVRGEVAMVTDVYWPAVFFESNRICVVFLQ